MMTIPNSGIAQAAKTIAGNFHIIKIIPARNYRRKYYGVNKIARELWLNPTA
jgi:hypothetical protein